MSESGEPGTTTRGTTRGSLLPGVRVEVRTGFDRSWAPGFTVEQVTDSGYQLRRRTDGEVLPAIFSFDDVRRERRNSMWWL
ncbi:MAG: hypothetical protein JWM05_1247 [Acidimicrobiales bacterium]|nr:hypothetical protein [Acidimicrobiales bacterium]